MGYFLITLSLFITWVFFIVISMFGISYFGIGSGSSLFLITVLAVNISASIYIFWYELHHKSKARGSKKPYFLPIILISIYFFESFLILKGNTSQSFTAFKDVISVATMGIWCGTFCYRYDKFKEIAKNLELIMFISTIGIIMAVPRMFIASLTPTIGGAGDHQILSYLSAVGFGVSFYRFFINPDYGYRIFNNKVYHAFSLILMLIQAGLCLIGGGRGGFVLLLLIAFFSLLAVKMSIKNIFLIGALGLSLLLLIDNVSGGSDYARSIRRVFSIFNSTKASDVDSERDNLFRTAWDDIASSPLIGYGVYRQYDMCKQQANLPYWHNLFIDFLMQGGIILFLIGSIIVYNVIRKGRNLIKRDKMHFLLIPLGLFPYTMLMFSGTYLTNSLFWFISIYILGKSKTLKK